MSRIMFVIALCGVLSTGIESFGSDRYSWRSDSSRDYGRGIYSGGTSYPYGGYGHPGHSHSYSQYYGYGGTRIGPYYGPIYQPQFRYPYGAPYYGTPPYFYRYNYQYQTFPYSGYSYQYDYSY
ncbi:MAG: hypothetical protein KDA78_01005 [Planctomycetaceae bacterium]|nr:hypothetical protein [Planctomycetaceae bacterium]